MFLLCHLTLSEMVALYLFYLCLLSRGSVLATLEAAKDMQGAGLLWCLCSTKLQHQAV